MMSHQKFELIGRPSLMLPPIFAAAAAVEEEDKEEVDKFEYEFYSPSKKTKNDDSLMAKEQDVIRFHSTGGQRELLLMQNKDNNWVGSSHGWLVLFNKINRNISLINPVSGRCILLPPFPAPFFPGKRIKVILSHSPDDEKCLALTMHGKHDYKRAAAFCRPGRSSWWSPLALGRASRYNDFVYLASQRSFVSAKRVFTLWLGLGETDELGFWDVESSMEAPVKTLRAPKESFAYQLLPWKTYVVSEEDSGRLFMVRRYIVERYRSVIYKVYGIEKYVGSGDVLQLRSSLDDLVMFIGMNHCFAVKASRFPEYRPNCIYFSGVWSWREDGTERKPLADVYDYNSKKYSRLFYAKDFPFHHNLPWFTFTQIRR